jgi:hypothetical protein
MPSNYEKNKANIYRYKQTHGDRWREINRRAARKLYAWKSVQRTFLHILL